MCGIIAYLGTAQAADILLKGLARLEYRGYDSAGLALQTTDVSTENANVPAQGKFTVIKRLARLHHCPMLAPPHSVRAPLELHIHVGPRMGRQQM